MQDFLHPHREMKFSLNSGGKCQSCGAEISLENFHADHIIPFSEGGITEIKNGQALCQKCNLAKGAKLKVDLSPWMPPGFEARGWQQDFWKRAFRSIIQQVDLPPSEIQAFMLHAFRCRQNISSITASTIIDSKRLYRKSNYLCAYRLFKRSNGRGSTISWITSE